MNRLSRSIKWVMLVSGLLTCTMFYAAFAPEGSLRAPIGVWRGTSTCTDRVAAPNCHDEVVVYEFTAGDKPGTVRWKADKVVDGQRLTMGEMDLVYDTGDACWRGEFSSPQVHIVWCLAVAGAHMTGTGRHLPGKETVRKVDAWKGQAAGGK